MTISIQIIPQNSDDVNNYPHSCRTPWTVQWLDNVIGRLVHCFPCSDVGEAVPPCFAYKQTPGEIGFYDESRSESLCFCLYPAPCLHGITSPPYGNYWP